MQMTLEMEKLCEGSTKTFYRLKQTTQPLAVKCTKNVKHLNKIISFE